MTEHFVQAPLHIGVGARPHTAPAELRTLIEESLALAGPGTPATLSTIDTKGDDPAIRAIAQQLGLPLLVHSAQALAEQCAPAPSSTVLAATGTPSVAEAAALLSAGPGAVLVVGKRKSPRATCAIARQIHKTPVPTAL